MNTQDESHRLRTSHAMLRDTLTDVVTSAAYAATGGLAGAQMLRLALEDARNTLALDAAGVQAYRAMQIQLRLACVGSLFAEELWWIVYGEARNGALPRPTTDELRAGLAEFQALTAESLALTQETTP